MKIILFLAFMLSACLDNNEYNTKIIHGELKIIQYSPGYVKNEVVGVVSSIVGGGAGNAVAPVCIFSVDDVIFSVTPTRFYESEALFINNARGTICTAVFETCTYTNGLTESKLFRLYIAGQRMEGAVRATQFYQAGE